MKGYATMAAKGRPKSDDARRIQFRLRLNDKEDKMLRSISDCTGLVRTDVLRMALERMYKEEERFIKAFSEPSRIGKDKEE